MQEDKKGSGCCPIQPLPNPYRCPSATPAKAPLQIMEFEEA